MIAKNDKDLYTYQKGAIFEIFKRFDTAVSDYHLLYQTLAICFFYQALTYGARPAGMCIKVSSDVKLHRELPWVKHDADSECWLFIVDCWSKNVNLTFFPAKKLQLDVFFCQKHSEFTFFWSHKLQLDVFFTKKARLRGILTANQIGFRDFLQKRRPCEAFWRARK